jgi:hypothetical protein
MAASLWAGRSMPIQIEGLPLQPGPSGTGSGGIYALVAFSPVEVTKKLDSLPESLSDGQSTTNPPW